MIVSVEPSPLWKLPENDLADVAMGAADGIVPVTTFKKIIHCFGDSSSK